MQLSSQNKKTFSSLKTKKHPKVIFIQAKKKESFNLRKILRKFYLCEQIFTKNETNDVLLNLRLAYLSSYDLNLVKVIIDVFLKPKKSGCDIKTGNEADKNSIISPTYHK